MTYDLRRFGYLLAASLAACTTQAASEEIIEEEPTLAATGGTPVTTDGGAAGGAAGGGAAATAGGAGSRTVRDGGPRGPLTAYFGDLHTHTNLSDGRGSQEDAYPNAKGAGADYLALTDHLSPGSKAVESINEIELAGLNDAADRFTDAAFVGIAGFEYTRETIVGHVNLFNTAHNGYLATSIPDFYTMLATIPDAIGQFNHPSFATDEFNRFDHLTPAADEVMCLLEIKGGNNETSYQLALSKGWHVAPAENTDSHEADWISGSSKRSAILAPAPIRADLYDAMKRRRVYATQDKNMRVSFTINGQPMGSRLDNPSSLDVVVTASDPDASDRINRVELIGATGSVVSSGSFNSNTVEWKETRAREHDYYYVRVVTGDGERAWTAPIWTKDGISGTGILVSDLRAKPKAVINTQEVDVMFSAGISDIDGAVVGASLDLSSLGGPTNAGMEAIDNEYSFAYKVPAGLTPGSRDITLTVTDDGGNQRKRTAAVEVRAAERYLNIYTDAEPNVSTSWIDTHGSTFTEVGTGAVEGAKCMDINYVITDFWAGGGWSIVNGPIDATGYDYLRLSFRFSATPHGLGVAFAFSDGTDTGDHLLQIPGNTSWTTVEIPLKYWRDRGYSLTDIDTLNLNVSGAPTGTGHVYIDDVKLVRIGG